MPSSPPESSGILPPPPAAFTALRESFAAHYQETRAELRERMAGVAKLAPGAAELNDFLSNDGKLLRPFLCLGSYRIFSGTEEVPEAVHRVGAALELFHAFALVHDDIIDQSDQRRGQPALHRRLERGLEVGSRSGEALAILAGDILFGHAVECFTHAGLGAESARRALRTFSRITQDCGLGESLELVNARRSLTEVTEEEILRTYHLKTTRYTIEGPLVIGATLAGAPQDKLDGLARLAEPLGLAFQIENDLHEVNLLEKSAAHLTYDLRAGIKTLFLKKFHEALEPDERLALDQCLSMGDCPESIAILVRLLTGNRVAEQMQAAVEEQFARAAAALAEGPFSADERAGLDQLVELVRVNCRHSEAG